MLRCLQHPVIVVYNEHALYWLLLAPLLFLLGLLSSLVLLSMTPLWGAAYAVYFEWRMRKLREASQREGGPC